MKLIFDLPDDAAKEWRRAKRIVAKLKKVFPPEVQKSIEKLDSLDEVWDNYIDDKLAERILDLQAILLGIAVVSDIKEEK